MRKECRILFPLFFLLIFLFLPNCHLFAANVDVTATSGITAAGYSNLKTAFDNINSGTHQGTITIKINASITETATAKLNASSSTVRIYPNATGLTISGSISGSIINLNGADKVVIDGRVGGSGSTASLSISNSAGSAVLVGGGAANNCIKYTTLKSSGSSSSVVAINGDNSVNNDNDSIMYCNLTTASTSSRPYCGINTPNWTSSTYKGLTIVGNNFYDLWNAGKSSYGIMFNGASASSTGIIISGNSFYETTDFKPSGDYDYYCINTYNNNNSYNVYTISNNYFGGRAPQCGGNSMLISKSNKNVTFNPINLNVGSDYTSYVSNNTIANITLISASTLPFKCINVFYGAVDIYNNTIGSSTGTGNITLTATGGNSTSYGIYLDQSSNNVVSGNTIGSITVANTSNAGHSFYGIYKTAWNNGTVNFTNNLIGSTTTPNSIQCTSPSSVNNSVQMLIGIYAGSNVENVVTGNTVGYLSNFSTNNSSENSLYGIYCTANGTNLIDRNFVLNLNATFSGSNSILAGIYIYKGVNICSNNIIYLGEDITSGLFPIYGIADFNDEDVEGYYNYNTIYITGTATGSTTANTSTFYKARWGEKAHLTNNILVNVRTGGGVGSGSHTAVIIADKEMLPQELFNSNYNDLYVSPDSPNSSVGIVGTTTYETITYWSTATGSDSVSLSVDPEFLLVGNSADGFVPTADLTGTNLDGTDFDDTERPDNPSMGAWETSTFSGISWTGEQDNDWSKTGNWTPQVVPTLLLPSNIPLRPNQPIIYSGTEAKTKKILIKSGAILTINGGGSLKVDSTIDNQNGSAGLVINSTSEGTGSLIHSVNNVQATVKRYVDGDKADWHFLSTPVSDQAIHGTDWTPSGSYGDGTGYDLYVWDEPTSCWVYNLNETIEPKWSSVHNENKFIPGRGYLYAVLDLTPTKQFVGTLNNGAISQSLTTLSDTASYKGFNFIGNPYPSSIDWTLSDGFSRNMLATDGGGYNIWTWSSTANNYGVYNSADTDGTGTNNVTKYIAPMQGFFVNASYTGTFIFNNAARVHNDAGVWLKSASAECTGYVKLSVISDSGAGSDEVKLNFGQMNNSDGAQKLFSYVKTAPSLYIPSKNGNFTTRHLTDTEENPKSAVSFKAGIDGHYTMKCQYDQSITGTVYLEDRFTGQYHNFNISGTYSFTASTSDAPNRFVLHYGSITPNDDISNASIYVNAGNLIVDLQTLNDSYNLQVYDLNGRLVYKNNISGGDKETVQLRNHGVYVVSLRSESGVYNIKVIY